MIDAKNENGKFSIPITLIGKNNNEITKDFYLDTGFDGCLKIDKKLFDELKLEKKGEKDVSFANSSNEKADMSRVKFKVDQAEGESEVLAVGWGGRNLLGTRFLQGANIILVIDNSHGIHLTTDRKLAYEIGKTIYMYHQNGGHIV